MEQMIYQKPRAVGFLWVLISYFITLLVVHTGMHDEYIYTSLVEKTYQALSILCIFKDSESWPNQNQFPLKLSKVLPNESYNPGQMSVLKWAIKILIFKCFHEG